MQPTLYIEVELDIWFKTTVKYLQNDLDTSK